MEWCTSLLRDQQQCVYWCRAMIWKDLMARYTWSVTAQRTESDRPVWEDPPLESQDSETTSFLSRLLFRGALLCPVLVPDLVSSFCPKDFMCTVSLRYGLSEAYKVLQTIRGALLIRVIMFLKKLVGWKRKYTKIYLRKLFINKILGPFTWLG